MPSLLPPPPPSATPPDARAASGPPETLRALLTPLPFFFRVGPPWLRSATPPLPGPLLPLPFARPCWHLNPLRVACRLLVPESLVALVPLGELSVSAAFAARSPRLKSEILSRLWIKNVRSAAASSSSSSSSNRHEAKKSRNIVALLLLCAAAAAGWRRRRRRRRRRRWWQRLR